MAVFEGVVLRYSVSPRIIPFVQRIVSDKVPPHGAELDLDPFEGRIYVRVGSASKKLLDRVASYVETVIKEATVMYRRAGEIVDLIRRYDSGDLKLEAVSWD